MAIREYECSQHGYFVVRRRISEPTNETCPRCQRAALRVYRTPPVWGIAGAEGGIPNSTSDSSEYAEWQRSRVAEMQDKLHVDNVGVTAVTLEKMTTKTATGKNR